MDKKSAKDDNNLEDKKKRARHRSQSLEWFWFWKNAFFRGVLWSWPFVSLERFKMSLNQSGLLNVMMFEHVIDFLFMNIIEHVLFVCRETFFSIYIDVAVQKTDQNSRLRCDE